MSPTDPHVHIHRHRIPGVGYRHDVVLADGTVVAVIDHQQTQAREVHVLPDHAEEPVATIHLDASEAATLALLLSTLHIHVDDSPTDSASVQVETMQIGDTSAAIGQTIDQLAVPDPDQVQILGIIRDDTPELLEDHDRPCRAGDRLVVAGTPTHLDSLRRYLL